MSKFQVDQQVTTFDPNFEPLVQTNSTGTITKVYDEPTRSLGTGYDVRLLTAEGTTEEFYFHEYELTEAS